MDNPTTSLLLCIFLLLSIVVASLVSNNHDHPALPAENLDVPTSAVLNHVRSIMAFGDAETYETGRNGAREYIKDMLVKGGISQENIFWHYFEWKEQQQGASVVWSGVNILVWLNKTALPNQKVRIFGAHYDTKYWGKNSTAGASSLAGVAVLMETALSLHKYQQKQKKANTAFEEVPYLFVFFDHHEPGALGSKALVNELDTNAIAYFMAINSMGFKGSHPILQTFPYDHQEHSAYTPRWLASLVLRAGFLQNIPVKIGSTSKARSLLYQAYRYHWHAVSYLDVDGPFSWKGVPSALLTDYDALFEPSPHSLKPTDQICTLEEKKVCDFSKLLSSFILVSRDHPTLMEGAEEISGTIFVEIFEFIFNGLHQYIGVGPYIVGFIEIASLSFVIICVVCFNSVYQYSKIYAPLQNTEEKVSESELDGESDEEEQKDKQVPLENENHFWQGHKILVVHMLLMSTAVLVDTVFAFEMLILSFLALSTIHFSRFYINIGTGFVCSILCVNFLYKDVIIMSKFGVRTHDLRELRLAALIIVYFLHSVLLLVYGYDYRRKKAKLKKN